MPHVASQLCETRSSVIPRQLKVRRQTAPMPQKSPMLQRSPEFHEFQRPTRPLPRRKISTTVDFPSLSLLITSPDNKHWDCGSIRHIRYPSASDTGTPESAVDSIFELPSDVPIDSPNTPNSSAHSPFVAELEDTSFCVISKSPISKDVVVPDFESYMSKLQRPEFSVHAAAAISSITAMEQDNRVLLERAIAAEEAAALLKEKNKSLQHRINYFASHPSHRPKTAPEKKRALSPPFNQPNAEKSPVGPSLLQLPQTPTPLPRRRSPQLSSSPFPSSLPLRRSEACLSPNLTPQSASIFREPPKDPFYITYTRSRASTTSSANPSTSSTSVTSAKRRPLPLALSQPLTDPYDIAPKSNLSPNHRPPPRASAPPLHNSRSISSIGAPIPGSVNKHTVTYQGVPIADRPPVVTISLAEAQRRRAGSWQGGGWEKRRADAEDASGRGNGVESGSGIGESWREKALPPNGPMSPSVVVGRVEMGCGDGGRWEGVEEEKRRRRTGVSALFRWGRFREC